MFYTEQVVGAELAVNQIKIKRVLRGLTRLRGNGVGIQSGVELSCVRGRHDEFIYEFIPRTGIARQWEVSISANGWERGGPLGDEGAPDMWTTSSGKLHVNLKHPKPTPFRHNTGQPPLPRKGFHSNLTNCLL